MRVDAYGAGMKPDLNERMDGESPALTAWHELLDPPRGRVWPVDATPLRAAFRLPGFENAAWTGLVDPHMDVERMRAILRGDDPARDVVGRLLADPLYQPDQRMLDRVDRRLGETAGPDDRLMWETRAFAAWLAGDADRAEMCMAVTSQNPGPLATTVAFLILRGIRPGGLEGEPRALRIPTLLNR